MTVHLFLARPARPPAFRLLVLALVLPGGGAAISARAQYLPPPDKVVAEYVRAVGGKKRLASVRDATFEWEVISRGGESGRARTLTKAPDSSRTDLALRGVETSAAASPRSAWRRDAGGPVATSTDAAAGAAKLRAALDPLRLFDYRKQNVLARTLGREQSRGEAVYVVEFVRREGGRLRYSFGTAGKLLLTIADEGARTVTRYGDYRAAAAGGPLVAHHVEVETEGAPGPLVLKLLGARFNTGLAASLFDPPGEPALDVAALLREVEHNQAASDERLADYTYTLTDTKVEISDRGEVRKRGVKVYEVYPLADGTSARKLLSEDGVPLTPGRLEREVRRVAAEVERAERRLRERRAGGEGGGRGTVPGRDDRPGGDGESIDVGAFLRACEFVSPRRETFRGRDAVVFDFRPRRGYKPNGFFELVISKSEGVMWVDSEDKQVVRLETRLPERYKIAGGFFATVGRGTGFVVERTRLAEGVWAPRFERYGASFKVLLVAGVRLDGTREYGDYKRFQTRTGDAALDAPGPQ